MPDGNDNSGNHGRETGFLRALARPVSTAIQFALVSSLSFSIALALSSAARANPATMMIGASWAMISAIIVTQDTRSATIDTAWLRIAGSLIGAIFGAVYLTFFPFSTVGLGILIGITVLVCEFLHIPGYFRLAAFTAGIVMVVSVLNPAIPPLINASTRFLEVIIGSVVAVGVAWVWQWFPHDP